MEIGRLTKEYNSLKFLHDNLYVNTGFEASGDEL